MFHRRGENVKPAADGDELEQQNKNIRNTGLVQTQAHRMDLLSASPASSHYTTVWNKEQEVAKGQINEHHISH